MGTTKISTRDLIHASLLDFITLRKKKKTKGDLSADFFEKYDKVDWSKVDTKKIRRRIEDLLRKDEEMTKIVALVLGVKLGD